GQRHRRVDGAPPHPAHLGGRRLGVAVDLPNHLRLLVDRRSTRHPAHRIPVSSIPVSSIPVSSVAATGIPVGSISGTSISGTSISGNSIAVIRSRSSGTALPGSVPRGGVPFIDDGTVAVPGNPGTVEHRPLQAGAD